jgi:hypothetical protein
MRTYWKRLRCGIRGRNIGSGDASVRLLQHTSYKKMGRLPLALTLQAQILQSQPQKNYCAHLIAA